MEAAYILLINKDESSAALEILGSISSSLHDKSAIFGNIILVDENFNQKYLCPSLPRNDWTIFQDLLVALETKSLDSDNSQLGEEQNCASVAETIHQLADLLPYSGIPVHLIWIHPQLTEEHESFLPTLGAVIRLVHWHNARIMVIHSGETTDSVQCIIDTCHCQIIPDIQSLTFVSRIWRGKISLTSKIEGHGIIFPGFSISCDDRSFLFSTISCRNNQQNQAQVEHLHFGRMIEVLDEIDIRTVPLFLMSPCSVIIHLESDHVHSKEFIQYVNSLDKVGLVARIAVFANDVVPTCADKKMNTVSWKEGIMADISNVQETEEEILPGCTFLRLLLMKNEMSADSNTLKAVVFTNPELFNTDVFRLSRTHVQSHAGRMKEHSGTFDVNKFIKTLPQISDVTLQEIHSSLSRLQMDELRDWLKTLEENGQSTVLTKQQLFQFLDEIQDEFLTAVLKDCPVVTSPNSEVNQNEGSSCVLDYEVEPLEWPERLALQYEENQKRTLRRFQSSDSTMLSSPLHSDESVTWIDAADFLHCFKHDGNAAIDTLSPVRQQSNRRVKRISSETDANLKWPECKDCQYHDVYYNRNKKDEQHAKHYSKIRDKLQKQETRGFCLSLQKTGSSTFAVCNKKDRRLFSPNRRSSRKLKSVWNKDEQHLSSLSDKGKSTSSSLHTQPVDEGCNLRRSPRKKPTSSFDASRPTTILPRPNKRKRSPEGAQCQVENESAQQADAIMSKEDKAKLEKQSRSQRHKKKLEQIVTDVLLKHGVKKDEIIYKQCETKLFQVTKFFVRTLPNSRNLSKEMRQIAEGQVTQVVDLEKRRLDMKKTKKSR